MIAREIIYRARAEIGLPPDFSSAQEEEVQLAQLSRVLSDIMRKFQPKDERFEITLVPGQYRYQLPRNAMWFVSAFLDDVDITHYRISTQNIHLPPEES